MIIIENIIQSEQIQDENQIPKKDTQARNWVFVINNPKLTEIELHEYLQTIINVRYFIFAREKGEGSIDNPEGTEHHQGYIEFIMPKKFSTMKGYFSADKIGVNGHIKPKYPNAKRIDNVNYVKKIGKHADKAHTRISDIYEWGEFIEDGERTDLRDMVDMKVKGASNAEIFEAYPNSFGRNKKFVNEMALDYRFEEYQTKYRDNLQVIYIYGATRTGKTSFVYGKHGYENVYTNAGYQDGKWFDGYRGQDVLLLDDYYSSFDFGLLLKYTDKHPLEIACRYQNKFACYNYVYITSNVPLIKQHTDIQVLNPKSWDALLQRIGGRIYNFDLSKELTVDEFTKKRKSDAQEFWDTIENSDPNKK